MATRRVNYTLSLVIGGVVAAVAAIAWAQDPDDALVIEQPSDRDVYAAHREVNIRSTIDGDLVAAGRRVTVDSNVTGDIIVAAQEIEIRSEVTDDLRAAGQFVRVMSPISGHIVAAGQTVTVSEGVGDWAWLAGDTVEVLGDVGGDLRIRARTITIDAEVDGNVQVIGDKLRLGPDANVRGDLRWRSENEADISPGAIIGGEFIEEPVPGFAEDIGTGRGLSFTLTVIVAVTVLFSLFPRPLRASADRIATRPFASLVLGFAVLAAMPVLAILLVFSPLDAWFGLAVLGIYVVTLFLSVLSGLFAVGDLALRRLRPKPAIWQSLAAIIVTVVAVGLLTYVPYLGVIVVLGIWLLGIGALSW
ncbi:MAG: polymer-forming cytoskeletal protein, partial [Gammaproteobacteria bacterium]|nr:polymer-forming cytoskeletal protein [Gammaproteobacteria bacterium]